MAGLSVPGSVVELRPDEDSVTVQPQPRVVETVLVTGPNRGNVTTKPALSNTGPG